MDIFQTRDNTNIAFQYVEGNLPTLVFIHGAYLALNEWQPQLAALKEKSYLLLDLRGHSRSDKAGYPYSVAQFADDIWQLLDYLDLDRVALCGHSLGGMVAQYLASQNSERVAKLVLVDTSYGVRSTWQEAFLTDLTLPMFNLVPVAWQAKLFANQIGKYSPDAKRYVQAEIDQHQQDPKNYREIWKAVTQFDGYNDLKKIVCPTLIMVGALNKQTHAQARMMKERIANSKLVHIENAGHMLNWDNSAQFNEVLLDFTQ